MKAPKLADLAAVEHKDPFSKGVTQQKKRKKQVSLAIRKTFTLYQPHIDHMLKVSSDAMKATGKTVSASEALQIIIDRDIKRDKS